MEWAYGVTGESIPVEKKRVFPTHFNFFVFQCRPSLHAVFLLLHNNFISDIILLLLNHIDIIRTYIGIEARSDVYGESSALVILYIPSDTQRWAAKLN